MLSKITIGGAIAVLLFPLGFFSYQFFNEGISDKTSEWATFATFFSGTTGTIGSIIAGYLLYRTLYFQRIQRIEQLFYNQLQTFLSFKQSAAEQLIYLEQEELWKHLEHKFRTDPKNPNSTISNPTTILSGYYNRIKELLLEGYSINKPTPRVKVDFNQYFLYIETLVALLKNSNLEKNHFDTLKLFFLAQFHDSELKMICYYYYLFYQIVKSTNTDIDIPNPVVESGIFSKLNFADDFARNFDPRGKFAGAFIRPHGDFITDVVNKRRENEKIKSGLH